MSDTPHHSHSSREDDASSDAAGTPDPGDETAGDGISSSNSASADRPTEKTPKESEKPAARASDVPAGKAPPKRSSGPASDRDAKNGSPAGGLKGLQKGEAKERRGLLARSKRLQNLLLSNRPLGVRNLLWATLAVLAVIAGLLAATGQIDEVARSIANSFREEPVREERTLEEVAEEGVGGRFSFADLTSHPDNRLQPYFTGAVAGAGDTKGRTDLIRQFRNLTDRFIKRMGVDDNFSMRIFDGRTDTLLEVVTLEEERQKYIEAGRPFEYNWARIDALRRQKTREVVDKWVARGIPQEPIRVKWGMATKTQEARRREARFIEYEVRLARFFGKSLLMTEIGTKETFNQDELVSPVNAKSRYQMMPSLLAGYGIHRYRLPTAAGNQVLVAEEHHPLITMEPAFKHAAASINAMGHEIPGISAYHTGVNNIYNHILVKFLRHGQEYISPGVTTADAYLWGVTEGFPIVSRNSTFGDFSREYVAAAYGALKAMEEATIDTSQTMLADRVQLRDGKSILLNELLTTLAEHGDGALHWNMPDSLSLYERFRRMNKHFHLPAGPDASGDSVVVGVPERGNVRLTATAQGQDVRFFLPPGARGILKKNGYPDLIDESAVFEFNHDTYPDPGEGLKTQWDRQYDQLISEIRHFGFTEENRQVLKQLTQKFEELASGESSHYREAMYDVIAKHRQFWRYPGWEKVSRTAQAVLGRVPTTPQQPEELPTQPMQTPENIDDGAAEGR